MRWCWDGERDGDVMSGGGKRRREEKGRKT